MLARSLPLKCVSLCIALILTYAVQGARNASVVSLFIPIEVKNTPEDKVLVRPLRRGVQVTLKGPSFLIGPVASSPPPMRVKLPDSAGNRVTVSFSSADIALPSSVEVLGIEPSQMEFVFEALERQDVRIEVPRIGELGQGLALEAVEISPKYVTVRGAKADLKQIKVIEADPINLEEIESSTELTLDLRIPNASVTPSTKSVVAKVVVAQQHTERIFAGRPIELRLASGVRGYEVNPSKVSIRLSGIPKNVALVEDREVIPFIRVAEIVAEKSEKVEVDVPVGMRVISVEPSTVMLRSVDSQQVKGTGKRK